MAELQEFTELREIMASLIDATPENFRMAAQIYADQFSLPRRIMNNVNIAISTAEASGPSVLFDFGNDPLKELELDDRVIEYHTRVVDLLIMTALGQAIEISEFQDYAKALVTLYSAFDFVQKVKNSPLKNQALQQLEQEWQGGTDFGRVQAFFKAATTSVTLAAEYCNITINALPEF